MAEGDAEFTNPNSPIEPIDVPSIPGQTVEKLMEGSGYALPGNKAGRTEPENKPNRTFSDALPLKRTSFGDIVSKLLRRRPLN